MVADSSFGVGVGKTVNIGDTTFTIVGTDERALVLRGLARTVRHARRRATTRARGPAARDRRSSCRVTSTPAARHTQPSRTRQAIKDLKRPLESASGTVDILTYLMWIVAAGIIGSILYVQAIERTRDFAVFKATGVTGRTLAVGLAFQAIVLALLAAIVAIVLSTLHRAR